MLHCEPIEKVAAEFIEDSKITEGNFDNVEESKYSIPDYWDIGEVYERLIEDSYDDKDIRKESGKYIILGLIRIFRIIIQIFIISPGII